MKFALSRLAIWPRDDAKAPRLITFSETGINLVAGGSRSGKSAIIKIMDYCLGSRSCDIPKLGPIRRSSAWYGIVLLTDEGYKLLARRDPDEQDSTDDYMVIESPTPTIPERPSKNTNRDAVKALLARLARLPQTNADFAETGSGYKGRASFGDMTAFLFQPQSIVANENVLFFETEEGEHARKLREIFPLVLGAVDADTLVRQHLLAEARRMLEKRRRQLEALNASISDYAGQVRGRFLNAVELGLLQSDVASIDDADLNVLLARLRDLMTSWDRGERAMAAALPASRAPRLAVLKEREAATATRIALLKMRHLQLRELVQARHISEGALARERDRLGAASWLAEAIAEAPLCPFCGSANHAASEELKKVRERVADVEAQWAGIGRIPPMLDAEEVEVRKALTQDNETLRQVRSEIDQLEQRTAESRQLDESRALFVGRLDEFLAVQRTLSRDANLAREIQDLQKEESELTELVDPSVIEQKKEDALLLISKYAQQYGKIVELEDNDAVIKLDTKALTIRVLNQRGESAWLHQLGSGANYLGYHVAMLLALHEFFVQRGIPYIPTLLALDQPSQTQFPDDMDEEAEQEEKLAVHKAFEAFDAAIERTGGRLQVIVSDHASNTVSVGIRHLTVVERWRWGRKLIPWHWDMAALADMQGKRADFALEDIQESVLVPALADMFSVEPATIGAVKIRRAVFEEQRIAFDVDVTINSGTQGPTMPRHAPRHERVEGIVRADLTAEVRPALTAGTT